MIVSNCRALIKNLKRKSEFSRTNRIRLDLLSFEQKEINEKKNTEKNCFSFSKGKFEEPKETPKSKFNIKAISINSQKTSPDSLDKSLEEEDSSSMSCSEEEI